MKVKIRDTVYDSNIEPIAIGFQDDYERLRVGNQIIDNFELKPGKRVYVQYPGEIEKSKVSLNTITEFIKDLL